LIHVNAAQDIAEKRRREGSVTATKVEPWFWQCGSVLPKERQFL
jgi:hypothetical protein